MLIKILNHKTSKGLFVDNYSGFKKKCLNQVANKIEHNTW